MADTVSVHDDEQYTTRFGWLASRYRRNRWWFFVVWLFYEFVRAGFLAGASTQPLVQVFGLLVVEIVAFIGFVILRPFEGQRLNVVAVYLLGISKFATISLSAAFDTRFGIARIPAAVIGIVIIVIQGFLTIAVMALILIGAVSSYMSILRNRGEIKPLSWNPIREKYFAHLDFAVQDIPRPRPRAVSIESMPELPKTPYFEVRHVKRMAKVEDEDAEFMREIDNDSASSQLLLPEQSRDDTTGHPIQRNRTGSLRSQASNSSLPKAARLHRLNWSRQDYGGSMGPGLQRALSDAHLKTHKESHEPIDRHPSLFGTYPARLSTPALSSWTPSHKGHVATPNKPTTSRLRSVSGSSSRPKLETGTTEENVPTVSKNDNAK
jgi:hypothetical protein